LKFMARNTVLAASIVLLFAVSFYVRDRVERTARPVGPNPDAHPAACRRIVSMAPSVTEMLYSLGLDDRLVGVTRFCKYPPQAQSLPKVGGFLDPNYEAIIAARPDLVILLQEHERSLPELRKLNLNTVVLCHKNIEGIIDSVRAIGRLCGAEARGRRLADDIQSRLDRIRSKTASAKRPRVMIAIDRLQGSGGVVDVYIAGADGFFSKMIELAGGQNVYRQGVATFPVVSAESIMRMDPEVIVDLVSGLDAARNTPSSPSLADLFAEGGAPNEGSAAGLSDWQSLATVEAVKQHRVYAFDRDYATVPGPRFIRFLEDLARLLHPEIDWNGT
jgi:iron complex transport system substrate-binding protein